MQKNVDVDGMLTALGAYTRWCHWCGRAITTIRPWQQHRDRYAESTHADDPATTVAQARRLIEAGRAEPATPSAGPIKPIPAARIERDAATARTYDPKGGR